MTAETKLYDALCELTATQHMRELSIQDVFSLLKCGMQLVERIKGYTGVQKKEMVIFAMEKVIHRSVSDPTLTAALLALLEPSIDTIVEVSKQEWLINLQRGRLRCCPFR